MCPGQGIARRWLFFDVMAGSFLLGRITLDVVRGMSVTQFTIAGHIALLTLLSAHPEEGTTLSFPLAHPEEGTMCYLPILTRWVLLLDVTRVGASPSLPLRHIAKLAGWPHRRLWIRLTDFITRVETP